MFERYFNSSGDEGNIDLYCFPYAGAGASAYHNLCRLFPADVNTHVARYPGREVLKDLPPLTGIGQMAAHFATGMATRQGAAFKVLWGHSMGALVAFELMAHLPAEQQPNLLVVSGRKAPQLPPTRKPVDVTAFSDEDFVDLLKSYNGIPQVLLDDADLLNYFLPQLRADFVVLEDYRYQPRAPMSVDIYCLNGRSDHLVNRPDASAWQAQTSGHFAQDVIEGGHFFLNEQRGLTVAAVMAAIGDCKHRSEPLLEMP